MALRAEKGRLLCGDPDAVLLLLDSASPVLRLELSSGPEKPGGVRPPVQWSLALTCRDWGMWGLASHTCRIRPGPAWGQLHGGPGGRVKAWMSLP